MNDYCYCCINYDRGYTSTNEEPAIEDYCNYYFIDNCTGITNCEYYQKLCRMESKNENK